MYATLHRFESAQGTTEEILQAAKQLAAALSRRPGFVSFALLAVSDGEAIAISVCESQADLVAADGLLRSWVAEDLAVWLSSPPQRTSGEIVVQRGM